MMTQPVNFAAWNVRILTVAEWRKNLNADINRGAHVIGLLPCMKQALLKQVTTRKLVRGMHSTGAAKQQALPSAFPCQEGGRFSK